MSRAKRFVFSLGACLVAGLFFEVGARVVLTVAEKSAPAVSPETSPRAVSPSDLNDYQQVHSSISWVWTLKPGFHQTMGEAIAAKERSGRWLAARYFRARADLLELGGDDAFLSVNAAGFRGPELLVDRPPARVVALGDSCTFGTFPEESTYPRALESSLAGLGKPAEVVNAGVEGYSPRHVLARIDDYVALEPDVVTIYLGWNSLFAERLKPVTDEAAPVLGTTRLFQRVGRALFADAHGEAREAFEREKRADREDPALQQLEDWRPSCLDDVEAIAARMERAGSRVVLITLPGLYTMATPSARALLIGHLPEGTSNPLVLAKMTERYNEGLKVLARRRGYRLVDLAAWSDRELMPREAWFFDSVHLHESGQAKVGAYLAGEIVDLVGEVRSKGVARVVESR